MMTPEEFLACEVRNIYDYFKQQLGRAPDDVSLRDMPMDSPCGEDCQRAIDAAKNLAYFMRMAHGKDQMVVDLCEDIVATFVHG